MKIHIYVQQGDIPGVANEIAHGVDIDCVDEYHSQTPLMYAVTSPEADLNMIRFLIENGANINAVDSENQNNVLELAVQSGNIDIIQFILDAGADINYQRPEGYDVLIDAMYGRDIYQDKNLIAILNLLISQGASVNGVSSYGESAIKAASGVGRFDAVQFLLTAGADRKQLEWTELMHTIVFGSADELKNLLNKAVDMTARDSWGRTPWLLSLQVGEVEKSQLLLASGANRNDRGLCGSTPFIYAIKNNRLEVFQWLITEGFDIEATDEFDTTILMLAAEYGATDFVRILLASGANPSRIDSCDQKAITKASNLPIVRMLVDAGEDINEINNHMRRTLTKVSQNRLYLSQISPEQYSAEKHRRFGETNPEIMEIDFWKAMVCNGDSAYRAKCIFGDIDNDNWNEKVWCYQRFGGTITQLPDARIVEISGEHEDYYDPDFCIYNDVVVFQSDGHFQIFGYPRDIFPPTDFHSATLVGEYIYIIGNLGYSSEIIYGETPVYRLHCDTFKIEKIETTGEKPGWISRHKAFYKESSKINITGGKICVMVDEKQEYLDNLIDYALDLKNLTWIRLDTHNEKGSPL
jgi:ankyrin repeat protein